MKSGRGICRRAGFTWALQVDSAAAQAQGCASRDEALKLIVLLCIVGVAYHFWRKHHPSESEPVFLSPSEVSRNGFVEFVPSNKGQLQLVLIITPPDCAIDEVHRADELQGLLKAEGIPSQRIDNLNLTFLEGKDMGLLNSVMAGKMPVVFVNGWVKNDPQFSEIIAEYNDRGAPQREL